MSYKTESRSGKKLTCDTASFTQNYYETDVVIWVGLTGDLNPIHIDHEYTKTTRFGRYLYLVCWFWV